MIPNLPLIYVTKSALAETSRLLASFARGADAEGVVYWFGVQAQQREIVTTLVVPDAESSRGHVRTSAAANAQAMSVMVDTPLVLLGQAHSHPSKNVDHSPTDNRDTFARFPGALSIVVPFFGRRGIRLEECGVYRHFDGKYHKILGASINAHLRVIPGIADFRNASSN